MTTTYIAVDCEFSWDEDLHLMHKSFDDKSDTRATAVKRVMATSAYEFTVDEEGRVTTGAVASWCEHSWGDEQAVVAQLCDYLRARPAAVVLTYGGLATDIPVLRLAAMEHSIALPAQLLDQPGRKGPRPHLDLGLMLKGGGRTWSHLTQVLLRMGVPLELVRAKPAVRRPSHADAWKVLRDHVELDVLLLGIAKMGWLVSQGTSGLRLQPAIISLVAGFLRRRPDHVMAGELRSYQSDLEQKLADRFAEAA